MLWDPVTPFVVNCVKGWIMSVNVFTQWVLEVECMQFGDCVRLQCCSAEVCVHVSSLPGTLGTKHVETSWQRPTERHSNLQRNKHWLDRKRKLSYYTGSHCLDGNNFFFLFMCSEFRYLQIRVTDHFPPPSLPPRASKAKY